MTTNSTSEKEDYFGLCPECQAEPQFRNVGRTHVAHCTKCRVKWTIGANLFSSWRNEGEADWKANADFLAAFRDVEPYHTPQAQRDLIASRGMTCPPTDDEVAEHEWRRRSRIEEAVNVVNGSGGWYVVVVPGCNAEIGGNTVDIAHGPLESREAAEFARRDAVAGMEEDGTWKAPSEVTAEHWNVIGRLLRYLRDHEGKPPEELAYEMALSEPWVRREHEPGPECIEF